MRRDGGQPTPVILSIDLASENQATSFAAASQRQNILERLQQLEIPATWFVSQISKAIGPQFLQSTAHELGLTADPAEPDFVRRLSAAQQQAAAIGTAISTLALPTLAAPSDHETLAVCSRCGIRAFRPGRQGSLQKMQPRRPSILRSGLCVVPVAHDLTNPRRRFWRSQSARLERQVAANQARYPLHLAIDLSQMDGRIVPSNVAAVLDMVNRLKQTGSVEVVTLRQFALRRTQQTQPSGQSILRAA